MELQVGVKVAIRKNDKFLLLKRSDKKYPEVGQRWDIAGGRIHPGIPLMENLKREVKEETCMDIVGEPKLIAAQDILRVEGRHVVRLTYIGGAEGEPRLDGDHTEFGWFTLEEIRKLENLDIYFAELVEKGIIKE